MSEVVALGQQAVILLADNDNAGINGSTPGQTGIPLTNFTIRLYKNAVKVADEVTIVGSPYLFSMDNLGDGRYRAKVTLGAAGKYSLQLKHSTGMYAWRIEDWDVQTLIDLSASGASDGNRKVEFVRALVDNPTRKVKAGFIDYMRVKWKRQTDLDWSSPVHEQILYYWYETLGDLNPIKVGENG